MIPQTHQVIQKQDWQRALATAIKDPQQLLSQLGLTGRLSTIDEKLITQFPLRVTQSYIDKMRYGDPADPLLRQVFPLIDESYEQAGFVQDPVSSLLAFGH